MGQSVCCKTQKLYCVVRWRDRNLRGLLESEDNCLDGGARKTTRTNLKYQEHTESAQVKFATEVGGLVQALEDMGNPSTEESEDQVLDSQDVADPAIVQTVRDIEKTGQDQYKYMIERVIELTIPVFDPISKSQIPLFSRHTIERSIENKANHHTPKE